MSDAPSTSPPRAKQSAFAKPKTERPRPAGSPLPWLLVAMMAGVIFALELPNEINAWKYAAALEARDAGKKEQAYRIMNGLLERNPQNERYAFALYVWNQEDDNFHEALVAVEQMLEVDGRNHNWLGLRSDLFMRLGRYPEALEDCRELKRLSDASGEPSRANALNCLAYTRAVGNFELDQAALDIEAAVIAAKQDLEEAEQELKLLRWSWNWEKTRKVRKTFSDSRSTYINCLDTRGFIRTKTNELQAAQVDLSEAIQQVEANVANWRLRVRIRRYQDFEAELKKSGQHLAVMYYHRSLNLQKLGREAEAKQDFDKARKLAGREPDETLF